MRGNNLNNSNQTKATYILIKEVINLVQLLEKTCRKKGHADISHEMGWWDTVKNSYNEERFKEMFGMSRGTFHYILGIIEPLIVKKNNVKAPIHTNMLLAI